MDGVGGISSLRIEGLQPAHRKFYTSTKSRTPMGRTRTPTAVLELRGAFKRNPNRRRKFEPLVTTALPEPPQSLPTTVKSAWLEMKTRGFWLTSADRFLVEIAATLTRYRFEEMKSGDVSQLIQLLGKLGFAAKAANESRSAR
jgi:hypothetical protein